ncbi:phosphotransferase family protein [Phycisphaerales bacterium AB-hyl4]|uniref:Phosphotransferase family protein n=1 Tax=Natronomicrosphaera hydrolytica TaxID=3242702 RepID=A0ABV4U2V3_9BACT
MPEISPDSEMAALIAQLRADNVVRGDRVSVEPLTGGVSSEIVRVRDGERDFVVKRALAKLRVAEDWYADTNRNLFERQYIEYVQDVMPEAVPAIMHAGDGYFVMEHLGAGFVNWKQKLLQGKLDVADARRAGHTLAVIHRTSAGRDEVARRFDTTCNFKALRVDPYLLTTAKRHSKLRGIIEAEAERLATTRLALVHGDYSPKNIMVSSARLVVLDCEVAWYGDPAFDLAFLLNHLFLKTLLERANRAGLRQMIDTARGAYFETLGDALDAKAMDARTARLLLMLMLARIDGKSPVEYLTIDATRQFVRRFVTEALLEGDDWTLDAVAALWFTKVEKEHGPDANRNR